MEQGREGSTASSRGRSGEFSVAHGCSLALKGLPGRRSPWWQGRNCSPGGEGLS